jgi:choline dehydrogenase
VSTEASTHDFVVVGGGVAGCVLAGRLAQREAGSVLLLEAGERVQDKPPALTIVQVANHSSWHHSVPQPQLGGRRMSLPQARALGGGSVVNGMMELRGHAANYDDWGALGNPGWSYRDVLPYFRRSEDHHRGESVFHGRGGPIPVSAVRYRPSFSEAFVEAAAESGLPRNDDFNGAEQLGAGFYEHAQRRGRRVTARIYLALARSPLETRCGARALHLIFEGDRAVGVAYERDGQLQIARARREVLVCLGAFGSPRLLLHSGLGPEADLARTGVPLRVALEGVGRELQDHLRFPVIYASPRSIAESPFEQSRLRVAWELLRYSLFGRGVLNTALGEAGGFARLVGRGPAPDTQFVTHWTTQGIAPLHLWGSDLEPCLIDAESRGSLTLVSADPREPLSWDSGALRAEADVTRAVAGIRFAREIAQAPALRRFGLGAELTPGPSVQSDAELAAYVRATAETCFHPAGTCRMGPASDAGAVVDHQFRVHGVRGLRVVDASAMPRLVTGNTTAPTRMMAERAADFIAPPASH